MAPTWYVLDLVGRKWSGSAVAVWVLGGIAVVHKVFISSKDFFTLEWILRAYK